jgi:hypothetical protein
MTVSFTLFSFLNPGIASTRTKPTETMKKVFCKVLYYVIYLIKYCELPPQPTSVFHCSLCEVCISGQMHHNLYFGKCIGRGNKVPYLCFITCVPIYIVLFLCVLVNF